MGRPIKRVCIDASIFGHAIFPAVSKAAKSEVKASREIIDKLSRGQIEACAPTILIAELKWIVARAQSTIDANSLEQTLDEIDDLLPWALGDSFSFTSVDINMAALAADYRLKYYSRRNAFSYNDGLYLATAVLNEADCLITTDNHLLQAEEIQGQTPSAYIKQAPKQQ